MKEIEEYLKKLYITDDGEPNSIHDSVENVTNVIKQAQLDAWNESVKECAENAVVDVVDHEELHISSLPGYNREINEIILPIYGVDDDSILKLLKE